MELLPPGAPERGRLLVKEAEAVTRARQGNWEARKQRKLIQVAETYLQQQMLDDVDWRIDVVAVEMDARGHVQRVDVIEHAVER